MFGFGKAKREATQASTILARTAIAHFALRDGTGTFDSRIWSDPYVLGLIHGSVSAQIHPTTGRSLSQSQKDHVRAEVVKSLGAPQEALDYGLQLAEEGNSDYIRGFNDALITWVLMIGALKTDFYLEPDIIAAKELVPILRKMNSDTPGIPSLDPDRELAAAFLFIKVREHKEAHYPPME